MRIACGREIASSLLSLLLLTPVVGCKSTPDVVVPDEVLMKSGLEALARNDPATAEVQFRTVLQHNPSHYGATFQLATALDRAGKQDEARPLWEKVLAMAGSYNDGETAAKARARLGQSEGQDVEAQMREGLALLYERHDPAAAAEKFRKVLEQNPTHYGATFQLASALDAAGKSDEARPLWQKMLEMAEAIQDLKTAEKARERIAAQGS